MLLPSYAALGVAIVLEVVGTTFLQKSEQFSRLWPSLATALCYAGAFYFLSLALRGMSVGVADAVWSGLGIVLISAIGYLLFRQSLDVPAMIGMGLIIAGVVVINVFSRSVSH